MMEEAAEASYRIMASGLPVARLELLDELAMRALNRYLKAGFPERPALFLEFHASTKEALEAERASALELVREDQPPVRAVHEIVGHPPAAIAVGLVVDGRHLQLLGQVALAAPPEFVDDGIEAVEPFLCFAGVGVGELVDVAVEDHGWQSATATGR